MESLHIKLTGRYIPGTGPPVVAPAPQPQPNMRRRHQPHRPHIAVLRKPVPRQPQQAVPRKVEVARPTPVVTAPPPPPVTENTVPEVVFEDETM